MKHLNANIKHLAEAEFPDRGPYLFGEDSGKRAKAVAEDVRALKGIQTKRSNHFSGSGGSNRSICPRAAARSGASPHGLRSQSSTDWTNPLSHSTGIRTRNHGTPRITGGENLFPPAKLEENHCRPMGVGCSSGIQVRTDEPAAAVAHTVFRDRREVCRPDFGRDRIYVGQEGHTGHSTRPNRRFLFPYLPCPQKRQKIQASCEPSSVEQVHPVQVFQNGRNPHSEGPLKEGRLHGQDRFKGCVFRSADMH